MDYIELNTETSDAESAEILMAELTDFPFESFDQEGARLKAYIPGSALAECKGAVDALLDRSGALRRTWISIEQQDWNAVWESGFAPVEIDGRIVIRAPFHAPRPDVETEVVVMPRMSFGTGHHATTCLMASMLAGSDLTGLRGLDMGSGTGVLALIAVKRGAAAVDAVDIDEWAYRNAIDNIRENGLEGRVTPFLGDVRAIAGRRYDFVLANINRNILLNDLPAYAAALVRGGLLLMSGILECDVPAVGTRAAEAGFDVEATPLRDGWAGVRCRKR